MGSVSYLVHISNGKSAIKSKRKLLGVAKDNVRKHKSPEYSSELVYRRLKCQNEAELRGIK